MFKGLIKKFKNFQNKRAVKRELKLRAMYFEIRVAVIKFYEDKQRREGKVELPPFMRADMVMKEYVKTDRDIIFYYKRCLKYGACERV